MSPAGGDYSSASALRQALTDRLRQRAAARGEDLRRLYRLVAFDRVLARLFADIEGLPWILKGGCALEVRYRMGARTTVDMDLTIPGRTATPGDEAITPGIVLERLREAAARDMSDGFDINIAEATRHFAAPPEGGARYPVEVRLAGRRFSNFHLDVGLGDIVPDQADWMTGEDFLAFARIPAATMALLPVPQQFAEKAHAYTLPRDGPANTRVKDLADMALMIERGPLDAGRTRRVLEATFDRRKTHADPFVVSRPAGGVARALRSARPRDRVAQPHSGGSSAADPGVLDDDGRNRRKGTRSGS